MVQFSFKHGYSQELELFPHIMEFALTRNSTVQLDSFAPAASENLRIYCVVDGKFEWSINHQRYTLFPGDVVLVLPGWEIGGVDNRLEKGTFYHLHLAIGRTTPESGFALGEWTGLSPIERLSIVDLISLETVTIVKVKGILGLLNEMRSEITRQEVGHITRVNHLIDSLLILVARQSTRQVAAQSEFSVRFQKFEQTLRKQASYQWTVDEMAEVFGLGATAFTEKVKNHTGFSPLNFLINIRISEAIKRLSQPDVSFTSIAFETGFYSSQHFSSTFKKFTGYTPGEFRRRGVVGKGEVSSI